MNTPAGNASPAATLEIPAKSARAVVVHAGQTLRVMDAEGEQVADLICYDLADPLGHHFCQARTRSSLRTIRVTTGSVLFSNRTQPLLTIIEDTVGVHDLLFPECNWYVYERVLKVGRRDGCFENLGRAVAPHGIPQDAVHPPFNIFMLTTVAADGRLTIGRAPSKAGDHVSLRAERDVLVAVSACADDVGQTNGGRCTPVHLTLE